MHKDINHLVRMDLNLLPILDTLLNEKSVSKTADKLNVTPPAISKSLNKIRDTFQDQLLVRSGMSLELTPLAVRLKPQLRELLDNIQTVLHQNIELNGSELPRSFNIVTNDILMSKLSYKLMKKSIQENTHHVFNFNYDNAATCMLRSDDIDLYIGEDKKLSPEVKIRTIGHSECVFIAKKDHPVLQMEKSLKELKEYILIVSKNKLKEEMESLYRERGYKRKIHGVSAGYLPMVENVIQTDSLGVVPLYVVEVLQRMNIEVDFFRPEFELPKVRIIQAWHPRYHNCSSHKWLRDISKDLLEF